MSNPRIWNRKLHRWGSAAVALPFLLVLGSGLLLQVKKQFPWVQPPEQRREAVPALALPDVLARVRAIPEARMASWDDVERVDVRPGKGLIKVIGHARWEVQLDAASGDVLQVAYRRSDLIEQLHDGSFFSDAAKTWIFLPVALIVLGLWMTGIYLFLLPIRQRRLNARAATARSAPPPRPAARA